MRILALLAQLNAAADQAVWQHRGDLDPYVTIVEGSSEFEIKEIRAVEGRVVVILN